MLKAAGGIAKKAIQKGGGGELSFRVASSSLKTA